MNEGNATNVAGDGSRPPSSAGRSHWARVSLWIVGFASVVSLVLLALFKLPVLPVASRTDELQILRWMAHIFGSQGVLALARPLAAVTFLTWIYRARARQQWFLRHAQPFRSSRSETRFSPSRSVYVWFIPLANLFLPYLEVRDLFSTEGTGPGDRPPHLRLWWGTFIGGIVAINVAVLLDRGGAEYRESRFWLIALHLSLHSIASFLCARWIAEFERRTARRTVPLDPG